MGPIQGNLGSVIPLKDSGSGMKLAVKLQLMLKLRTVWRLRNVYAQEHTWELPTVTRQLASTV
jgi:hypothetical protein